jgi:hypothetical protein
VGATGGRGLSQTLSGQKQTTLRTAGERRVPQQDKVVTEFPALDATHEGIMYAAIL